MNSGKKALLALAISALISGYAMADENDVPGGGGKITFNGTVTNAPCTIKDTDTDKKVGLGEVSQAYINSNTHSDAQDFDITLENCTVGTYNNGAGVSISKVNITFTSSNVVSGGSGLLSNTAAGGASNVGVRLMDGDGTNITLGTAKSLDLNKDSATQTLPFKAWMEKTVADAGTGVVTATVNYTLIYN